MPYILLSGNCQCAAIASYIRKATEYKIHLIQVHNTTISKDEMDALIRDATLVITQPVSDMYRAMTHLSTLYILGIATCPVVIFPSLHFDFYYPDYGYLSQYGINPAAYHYKSLLQHLKAGGTVDTFVSTIADNPAFMTSDVLLRQAQYSISELKRREEKMHQDYPTGIHIDVTDFMCENFKKALLFYTVNHPTRVFFEYLLRKICAKIPHGIIDAEKVNWPLDPLANDNRGYLYACVAQCVAFDTKLHEPALVKFPGTSLKEILEKYAETYRSLGFL